MNIVIIGDISETSKKMIVGQFPSEWKVVIGTVKDTEPELAEAEVIIP
jgi:hypothetical protein